MKISARAAGIGESATLKVARRAQELKAQGIDVLDFGAGEPDFASPGCAVEAAVSALRDGFTKYTAVAGTPELRAALAERYARDYGAPWKSGQVVVGVGAKGILFELFLALLDPGDQVVLPSPYWVSFPEQIRFCGAEPLPVPTDAADGFALRADPLLAAVTPRTRAIVVNSPCNPTGGVMAAAELLRLAEEAARRGVLVISDETYERFLYDGRRHASVAELAAELPETVVLVGSFSKTYAMTGWRLGYLLGPPAVIQAVAEVQSHATSNPTSFAMPGAATAMAEAEPDVEAMIAEYAARRDLVAQRMNAIPGVSCAPPAGAFYAFPDVSAHYRDGRSGSVAFSEFLLEKARVAVVPGLAFGADAHVRFSFACSREQIEEGLERMAITLAG
jgi:aspartate aminotransferase